MAELVGISTGAQATEEVTDQKTILVSTYLFSATFPYLEMILNSVDIPYDQQNPGPGPAQLPLSLVPNLIPDIGRAVGDFNSVPRADPPYRDPQSFIIAALTNPDVNGREPDWGYYLTYHLTPNAIEGPANLQDLYLLITRFVLPRLIIENRRFQHVMYLRFPHLQVDHPLRYDSFGLTAEGQVPLNAILVTPRAPEVGDYRPNIPLNYVATVNVRPILRTTPTPDGSRFVEWLNSNPPPLSTAPFVPDQVHHRPSELDNHLAFPEATLRALPMGQLIQMTIRVLSIFWFLSQRNAQLGSHLAGPGFGPGPGPGPAPFGGAVA